MTDEKKSSTAEQHDFTQGSVAKAILGLAVPMTIAQLVNILYNVVDRMYVGRMPGEGQAALTGLGICIPIISILTGFANLCGMGGGPLCSIARGKGDHEEGEKVMGNSFVLLLLFGVVLTVLCLAFCQPILRLFGASDAIFPYAYDYLKIYLLGTLFMMVGLGMNPFISAQGFGNTSMLTIAFGAVVNIVLDPIFIFVLDMGVAGAAWATVISQACSAVWVMQFLTGKKTILRLRWAYFPLKLKRVWRILSLGMASFIMNLTNSLVQMMCNASLAYYGGDLYVGVMTVINAVRSIISMPIMGVTSGAHPVMGYNYGAKEYGRVREGIVFTTKITLGYAVLTWIFTMLFPGVFIRMFNGEAQLLAAGIPAFRIYYATFFTMAFQMVGQTVFLSLNRSKQAIFFSALRKVIIVAPLILLFPLMGMGVNGVFWAEPVSNVIGGLACFLTMYVSVYKPLGLMEAAGEQKGRQEAKS